MYGCCSLQSAGFYLFIVAIIRLKDLNIQGIRKIFKGLVHVVFVLGRTGSVLDLKTKNAARAQGRGARKNVWDAKLCAESIVVHRRRRRRH